MLHADIHIKYLNHIPAALQGAHFLAEGTVNIWNNLPQGSIDFSIAYTPSNGVSSVMTFLGFYRATSSQADASSVKQSW